MKAAAVLMWIVMALVVVFACRCGGEPLEAPSPDAGADCGPGHAGVVTCLGAHGG